MRFWPHFQRCRGWAHALVLGLSVLAAGRVSWAQGFRPLETPVVATSRSGQFMVHGRSTELPAPPESLSRVGTNALITLRPDLLVVTAERVKRAVEQRLDAMDSWKSRIHLRLGDTARYGGRVSIRPQLFADGWQFGVPLPERIEWDRLVRTLVEVILLERANRFNPNPECALVPLWLSEGMTQLLLAEEGRDLVAEAATVLNRSRVRPDPLALVRETLAGRDLMSFSELGVVPLDDLADDGRFRQFRASSALLTWELVRDDSGRLLLRTFLQQLPKNLNWQTTYLNVSKGRFLTLLEVEKWWAVVAADTLSAGPTQRWTKDHTLDRLADLLVETTDVRETTNSPAVQKRVPVAEVIERWDFPTQRDVLRRKVSQLRVLSQRAPGALAALCNDYARLLQEYLQTRERMGLGTSARGELETRSNLLVASYQRRLAELDRRVQAERDRVEPRIPGPAELRGPVNPVTAISPPAR